MPNTPHNPVDAHDAVAKARTMFENHTQIVSDMCDHYCASYYHWQWAGEPSAYEQFQAIPEKYRLAAHETPQPGMLAFWGGPNEGYGHIALVCIHHVNGKPSTRYVYSTDAPTQGYVGKIPHSWVQENWGLTPLGFTLPVFVGAGPTNGKLVPWKAPAHS